MNTFFPHMTLYNTLKSNRIHYLPTYIQHYQSTFYSVKSTLTKLVGLTKLRCGAVALLRVALRCSKAARRGRDQECVEG